MISSFFMQDVQPAFGDAANADQSHLVEDFISVIPAGSVMQFAYASAGGATTLSVTGQPNADGVLGIRASVLPVSRIGGTTIASQIGAFFTSPIRRGFGFKVMFKGTNIVGDRYFFRCGLGHSTTTILSPSLDFGFFYDPQDIAGLNAGLSPNLLFMSRDVANAISVVVDTGIPPLINTWYNLFFEEINNEVNVYVDGTITNTLTAAQCPIIALTYPSIQFFLGRLLAGLTVKDVWIDRVTYYRN